MRNLLTFTTMFAALIGSLMARGDGGLAGEWQLEVESRRGTATPTLSIEASGDGYKGVLTGRRGP